MMRRRTEISGLDLTLRQDPFGDRDSAAYEAFLCDVFDFAPARSAAADPPWERWAYFDASGQCVAGLEVCGIGLVLDGADQSFAALRLVGVAATHRGRGLFRDLVTHVLPRCDARGPTLLYTEEPALYTRFGFTPLAQHAFVSRAPEPVAVARPAVRVDAAHAGRLIDRLAQTRARVSLHCAMSGATDLLRAALAEEGLSLAYAEDLDALLVYETGDEELVLVDVVAAEIPTMGEIVATLRLEVSRVRTLFPPDRLHWQGTPEPDETGLMIRGALPVAMRRPFMLPPTTSF